MAKMINEIEWRERGLDKVQQRLKAVGKESDATTSAFGKLRNAIAGVAVGAFIGNTIKMAAAMSDMAKATGSSTASVIGFGKAIVAAGGTMDRARDGLSDFTKNLGEAANGSAELQKAFAKAGVSLKDLATLSEEQLRNKTVKGLAAVNDHASRTAATLKLFGESMKGVDVSRVAAQLDTFTDESRDAATAADASAEAMRKFTDAMQQLQDKLLITLTPLIEFANSLLSDREAISKLIDAIQRIVVVLGSLFIISKITALATGLARGLLYLNRNANALPASFKLARQGLIDIEVSLRRAVWQFGRIRRAGAITTATLIGFAKRLTFLAVGFTRLIPVIGQVYLAFEILSAAIDFLKDTALGKWIAEVADEFGKWISETFPNLTRALTDFAESFVDYWGLGKKAAKDSTDAQLGYLGQLDTGEKNYQSTYGNRRNIIDQITNAVEQQVATYKRANETFLQNLRDELKLLGFKEDQVEAERKILDFQNQHKAALAGLEEQLKKIDQELNPEQYAEIKQKIDEANAAYEEQLTEVKKIAYAISDVKKAQDEAKKSAEDMAAQLKRVNDAAESTAGFIADIKQSTVDAQREFDQLNMGELEKSLDNIGRDIQGKVTRQVEILKATLANVTDPTLRLKLQSQIDDIVEAGKRAQESQEELAKKSYQHQRSFTYGWQKAMRSYVEDATNAAKTAESLFDKTFKGMEDIIVNFVKTGKFEWKEFLASILEELFRAQITSIFAKIIQTLTGGLLGSATGGATGGTGGNLISSIGDIIGGLFGGKEGGEGGTGGIGDILGSIGDAIGGIFGGGEGEAGGGGGLGGLLGSLADIFGVGEDTNDLLGGIGDILSDIEEALGPVGGGIGGAIGQGIGGNADLGGAIGNIIGGVVEPVKKGLFAIFNDAGQFLQTASNEAFAEQLTSARGGFFKELAEGEAVQKGGGLFQNIGGVLEKVAAPIGSFVDAAKGVIGDVGSFVSQAVESIPKVVESITPVVSNVLSSIGSGIGSVVGGIADTVGSIFSGGGSFLDDVIGGIGDFFGGFFAAGGKVPAGKIGVVGEYGPEFVSGPSTVTPLEDVFGNLFGSGGGLSSFFGEDLFGQGGGFGQVGDFGDIGGMFQDVVDSVFAPTLSGGGNFGGTFLDDITKSFSDAFGAENVKVKTGTLGPGQSFGSFFDDFLSGTGLEDVFGGLFGGGGGVGNFFDNVLGGTGGGIEDIFNNILGPTALQDTGQFASTGLGAGPTNITYNINAVDARSFKELVARDPEFLYSVVLQGAKSSPIGRR